MRNLLAGLIALAIPAFPALAEAPKGVGGSVNGAIVWVPDYYGRYVLIDSFDNKGNLATATIPLADKSCNPNALTVQGDFLYVVCNSDFGGTDQILVYDATSLDYVKTITGTDVNGADYFTGGSLTGITFDARGNLWTTAYAADTLLRVPKANLGASNPHIDREVIHSPDSPAGLALDHDKSIWVVGQYSGGIVVNFTDAVLNQKGSFLKNNPLDPSPRYCISNSISGCQQQSGLFDNPEGVAVFHGDIWVSNNGGNAPAATIVRLTQKGGQLDGATYGGAINKPFACPGGVFSATGPTGIETLWINDEGRNVPHTDCGSSSSDQSATAGLVMEFLNGGLKKQAAPANDKFSNWNKLKTSSPGFGGIFVQLK
ncbi:MAG TPA: hypothetical protein VGK90_11305 [Rhizomicrobium sp.]